MAEGNQNVFVERYLTPLAVLLAAVIIALAVIFGGSGDRAARPNTAGDGAPQAVDIANVKTGTGPAIGNPDAPVTMAVWYDFQCRFCKMFETTTLAEVRRTYVANGQVRILYKDFQFLGPESIEAAVYSRAVWEAYPDRWHEWFVRMFETEAEGTPSGSGMDAIARSLGLDVARITELRTGNREQYLAAIEADILEGQSFGINGTPATITGDQLISGAVPFAEVAPVIEAQL